MKANGTNDYFWKTEQDQDILVKLESRQVPYHIVIAAATVAFKECDYSKELLRKASMEWDEKEADGILNLDLKDTYKLFLVHWNKKLKLIHLHSDIPKGKANKTENVTQLVKAAVARALAAQASIADNFNDVILAEQMNISRRVDELQNSSSGVPLVIGTEGSAMSTL